MIDLVRVLEDDPVTWLMVTEDGEKPVLLMVMVLVAATPAAARVRAPTMAASVPEMIFSIVGTSLGLHRR